MLLPTLVTDIRPLIKVELMEVSRKSVEEATNFLFLDIKLLPQLD